MANILEFLRTVLTDADAQGGFRADPTGYLDRAGFADLTGEDVVEAVEVLRRSLPEPSAAALSAFGDSAELPPGRPLAEESELDAAARVLGFAVDRSPVVASVIASVEEPTGDPPLAHGVAPLAQKEPDAVVPAPFRTSDPAAKRAPIETNASSLPSIEAFSEALATAADDMRSRFDDALERFTLDSTARAQEASDRYAELLRHAEGAIGELRASAEADATRIRDDAVAEREAARIEREKADAEGHAMRQRATAEADAKRGEAEELLSRARAEADASRRDIETRKAELRQAEGQLRERLSGIDSLFRSVLRDDDSGPTAT